MDAQSYHMTSHVISMLHSRRTRTTLYFVFICAIHLQWWDIQHGVAMRMTP